MLVLSKTCQKSERTGGIYRQNCQTAVKTFAKIDDKYIRLPDSCLITKVLCKN